MSEIDPSSGRRSPSNGRGESESARDWYYRIGERERGPLTLVQLTELVASSGDVAREIEVRHYPDGEWVPYESIDATTAKRLRDDRSDWKPPRVADARGQDAGRSGAVPSSSTFSARKTSFHERLRLDWPIAAGVLVLAVVNVVLWIVLDPYRRTERKYFETLANAAQKAHDARAQGINGTARGRMAAAVVQSIKPIVDDLKQTANSSDPVRQHLLWAAKDQLPKLFSADGKELDECERIFQRHMYEAGRRLGIEVSRPATSVVVP
jgi:hypothetical protein